MELLLYGVFILDLLLSYVETHMALFKDKAMPKSSSVSKDPSSSKTAKRKEYVAQVRDENQNAEVNLHSTLPVLIACLQQTRLCQDQVCQDSSSFWKIYPAARLPKEKNMLFYEDEKLKNCSASSSFSNQGSRKHISS
ncbi:hypothetical protein HAX54_043505 [Datura stramonium]|uniref:Uncharacterized protein n=1 Tax=Datura stramonium TaxID=4076 RepID=A0ABS8SNL3_DATST|nr:hypothetical protein [Datura stramonium]